MQEHSEPAVYQLRIVLLGISPLIWRRVISRAHATIRPKSANAASGRQNWRLAADLRVWQRFGNPTAISGPSTEYACYRHNPSKADRRRSRVSGDWEKPGADNNF